jgi:integrase
MSKRREFGFIRKLPSGNIQASYIGEDGLRHNAPRTFGTRTDANAWLAKQQSILRSGNWGEQQERERRNQIASSFNDFALRHIEIQTTPRGDLLQPSTKELYKRLLRHNLAEFAHRDVTEITSPQISEWWARAISKGHKTSASKAYKLLSAVMNRAVGEKLIPSSPCMVKGAQSAVTGKVINVPNAQEVAQIVANINPRYSSLVALCAYGGFRFGEVTELRRKDFHKAPRGAQEAYEVHVKRAVQKLPNKFVTAKPKSHASTRIVKISGQLTHLIDQALAGIPDTPEALLFPAASGKHLRHDVFMNSWRPALKRAGLETSGFTPHTLRHFAGTYLHRAGANIAELKAWLGDSSTSAVMRYIHETDRAGDLVEQMEVNLD